MCNGQVAANKRLYSERIYTLSIMIQTLSLSGDAQGVIEYQANGLMQFSPTIVLKSLVFRVTIVN
jgi:hypothetical protein